MLATFSRRAGRAKRVETEARAQRLDMNQAGPAGFAASNQEAR
jgi:hypothetical protein